MNIRYNMKNTFILATILGFFHCTYGQILTSKVKVEQTNGVTSIDGLVGIGTSTPSRFLEVISGTGSVNEVPITARH